MNISAPTMPAEAKIADIAAAGERSVRSCCTSSASAANRGEHEGEPLLHDEARGADRQHQQRRKAAVHAAARVGQERMRSTSTHNADEGLQVDVGPALLDAGIDRHAEQEVGDCACRRTTPDAPARRARVMVRNNRPAAAAPAAGTGSPAPARASEGRSRRVRGLREDDFMDEARFPATSR